MTLAKFKELAALPGAVVALLVALAWLLTLMNTGKRLDGHVVQESTYHRNTRTRDSAYRRKADSVMIELHTHLVEFEKLQEAQIRGECLENPKADLARQGLLVKCRALGIER